MCILKKTTLMNDFIDYYEILKIQVNASEYEIEKAYKNERLAITACKNLSTILDQPLKARFFKQNDPR